jgi:hypothetical protein
VPAIAEGRPPGAAAAEVTKESAWPAAGDRWEYSAVSVGSAESRWGVGDPPAQCCARTPLDLASETIRLFLGLVHLPPPWKSRYILSSTNANTAATPKLANSLGAAFLQSCVAGKRLCQVALGLALPNPAYLAEKRGLRATTSNTMETASSGCRMSNV